MGSVVKACGGGKDVGGHVMVPVARGLWGWSLWGRQLWGICGEGAVGIVAEPAAGTYRKPVGRPMVGPVRRLVGNLRGVCEVTCGGGGTAGKEWGL